MNNDQIRELDNLLELTPPPSNKDAEVALLSSIFLKNDLIDRVKNIIEPGDFYDDRNSILYKASLYLFEKGTPVDIVTLTNLLKESSSLEYAGGVSYVSEIYAAYTDYISPNNIDSYAKIIKQKSLLRKLVSIGSQMNRGRLEERDAKQIIDELQKGLDVLTVEYSKVYSNDNGSDKLYQYHELVDKTREFINKTKIPTFFPSVDEWIDGGLQGGELAIISAPTKQGKTSVAQTWSYLQAVNKIPSVWFSFEMSWQELTKKFMMMDVEGELEGTPSKLPLYYPIDNRHLSLEWLDQKIKQAIKKYGARIAYIDHLHFLLSLKETSTANVSLLLGGIVREIKKIAVRNDIPIVLIAHIRKIDSEEEPKMSDIRDSSFVSQESDFTFLLWRERIRRAPSGKYNVETKTQEEVYTNMATLALEANRRNGITKRTKIGMINGRFYPEEDYNKITMGVSTPVDPKDIEKPLI
jgi:replicative DNA helicase